MSLWHTVFPLVACLICPCGMPYFPLWHALFAPGACLICPVACLICPCGMPYLPLWHGLFVPVADAIYPRGKAPFPFYLLGYFKWLGPREVCFIIGTFFLLRLSRAHFTPILGICPPSMTLPCAQVSHFTGYSAAGGLASLAILYYIPQV